MLIPYFAASEFSTMIFLFSAYVLFSYNHIKNREVLVCNIHEISNTNLSLIVFILDG